MEPLKGSEMLGGQTEDVSGRLGGLAEVVAGEASESEDDSVEEKTIEYGFVFFLPLSPYLTVTYSVLAGTVMFGTSCFCKYFIS
jgi:hypothetical protein